MPSSTANDALTQAILGWLLRHRRLTVDPDPATGHHGLGYGRPVRLVSILMFLVATGFLVLSTVSLRDRPVGLLFTGAIFGAVFLGTLHGIYDAFLLRLTVSEEGLGRGIGAVESVDLRWSEITGIDYSETWHWIRFRSDTRPTLRVSIYRDGLLDLAVLARDGLEACGSTLTADLIFEKARDSR